MGFGDWGNVENPIKQDEKKLVNLCVTNLKNEQNQISKEDVKNFLICVVESINII